MRRAGEGWGHTHRISSRTRDALENNSSGGEHVPASQGSEDGMRWIGVEWDGMAWHSISSQSKDRQYTLPGIHTQETAMILPAAETPPAQGTGKKRLVQGAGKAMGRAYCEAGKPRDTLTHWLPR